MTLLTQTVSRLLLAPLLVLAVGLLVKGYTDVGDGFAAGILAAIGVIMQQVAFGPRRAERLLPARSAYRMALGGLLLALLLGIVLLLIGEDILTHRPLPGVSPVKIGTLELITAVLFDVAVFLLVLGTSVAGLHLFAQSDDEQEDRR